MRRTLVVFVWLASLVSAAVVIVPALLLQPFKPQTVAAVAAAYRLRDLSPLLTAVVAGLVLVAAAARFRRARLFGKVGYVLAVGITAGAAWLARQNHFEWMFNPLKNPAYASVDEAQGFVDPSDMLIAVSVPGDAVAYPVRQMAYHHLVNDQIGGLPVVSTY